VDPLIRVCVSLADCHSRSIGRVCDVRACASAERCPRHVAAAAGLRYRFGREMTDI